MNSLGLLLAIAIVLLHGVFEKIAFNFLST
jgi:hypothetical protein